MNISTLPGIFSWFGYDLPILNRFSALKQASFEKVSIWLGDEEELAITDSLDHFPIYARKTGVIIECAHASYNGTNLIWCSSDKEKQTQLDFCKRQVDFCERSNIPTMVMHIVAGDSPPPLNEDGLLFMRQLVQHANVNNVRIALENTRVTDALYYLLERIDSPSLGICYDSSHDFLYSETPTKVLRDLGERLLYTHFSDNDGKADSHWLPGTGVIDWDMIIKASPDHILECISLEAVPHDPESEPIDGFLQQASEVGKWLVNAYG